MSKSVYMSEKKAKKAILDIGQRMYVRNFVAANDGNISIRTGENEVWATPTGVSKGFMKKKMLVKVDLEGSVPALPLQEFLWTCRCWQKR